MAFQNFKHKSEKEKVVHKKQENICKNKTKKQKNAQAKELSEVNNSYR